MVEGAALEMLCGATHLGFESLTLRQKEKEHQKMLLFLFEHRYLGRGIRTGRRSSERKKYAGGIFFSPRENPTPSAKKKKSNGHFKDSKHFRSFGFSTSSAPSGHLLLKEKAFLLLKFLILQSSRGKPCSPECPHHTSRQRETAGRPYAGYDTSPHPQGRSKPLPCDRGTL